MYDDLELALDYELARAWLRESTACPTAFVASAERMAANAANALADEACEPPEVVIEDEITELEQS